MKIAVLESSVIIFRGIIAISQYDVDNDEENRVIAAQARQPDAGHRKYKGVVCACACRRRDTRLGQGRTAR